MQVTITMPIWLWVILGAAFFWLSLFALYLAYTSIYMAKKSGRLANIALVAKASCYALYIIGLVLDVAVNVLASFFFVEPIWFGWLTLTARAQRHLRDEGFRGRMARWLCERVLDPFQEGGHC